LGDFTLQPKAVFSKISGLIGVADVCALGVVELVVEAVV
jgi:hypothetical protein